MCDMDSGKVGKAFDNENQVNRKHKLIPVILHVI
jgi:hypothetical protein